MVRSKQTRPANDYPGISRQIPILTTPKSVFTTLNFTLKCRFPAAMALLEKVDSQ